MLMGILSQVIIQIVCKRVPVPSHPSKSEYGQKAEIGYNTTMPGFLFKYVRDFCLIESRPCVVVSSSLASVGDVATRTLRPARRL